MRKNPLNKGVIMENTNGIGAVPLRFSPAGGIGHTLPYLIREFRTATAIAVVIVAIELLVISWIRKAVYGYTISPRRISSDRGRSPGISSWDLDRPLVTIEIGNWKLLQSWDESRRGSCAFASPEQGRGRHASQFYATQGTNISQRFITANGLARRHVSPSVPLESAF
jgi:hypothetical protein